MRSTKLWQYVMAVGTGLMLCGAAQAQDWKVTGEFGWLGVGKAYQIEKGHVYWLGEFSGTFFNDKGKGSPLDHTGWKCSGFDDLDSNKNKKKAAGYCIISDPGGEDQAYASWACEDTDLLTCHGTLDYTGGTGKYQGISGHNTFVGHTVVSWPDGTASGYTTVNR
jgi:hypothetical protein